MEVHLTIEKIQREGLKAQLIVQRAQVLVRELRWLLNELRCLDYLHIPGRRKSHR